MPHRRAFTLIEAAVLTVMFAAFVLFAVVACDNSSPSKSKGGGADDKKGASKPPPEPPSVASEKPRLDGPVQRFEGELPPIERVEATDDLAVLANMPIIGARYRTREAMQLRSIHVGLLTFAQNNKTPTGDGFFPGLKRDGSLPDEGFTWSGVEGTYTAESMAGDHPATRYSIMINKGYITTDVMISPLDRRTKSVAKPVGQPGAAPIGSRSYSYAMLRLDNAHRKAEWSETINSQAAVMSTRNLGTVASPQSYWTKPGSGEWRGNVVYNDGAVMFEGQGNFRNEYEGPFLANTRYNKQPVVKKDNLFVPDDGSDGANAAMVYAKADDHENQK